MKIVHVLSSIENLSAGTTDAVLSLCEHQSQLGHDVVLIALDNKPSQLEVPFKIICCKRDRFPHPALGASKELYKRLEAEIQTCDVVHNHMLWMAPNYYAGLLAKKHKKLSVCSPHGALTKYARKRSRFKKFLSMLLGQYEAYKSSDLIHFTDQSEKAEIGNTFWDRPSFILPIGINGPKHPGDKVATKEVLFLSRVDRKKGVDLLVQAFLNLKTKHSDWSLRIVGPLEDIEYFESFKSKICEENRIKYQEPVFGTEKFSLMTNAEIFVLPTHSENFGLVVGESLLCGTPVICSTGAPWQQLEDHNAGRWVELDNIESALDDLMGLSFTERKEMGTRGKLWIEDVYSWRNIAEQFIRTYQENLR